MALRAVCFALPLLIMVYPTIAEETFARRRVLVGWEDVFRTDQGWRAEGWHVRHPDPQATSQFGPGGALFQVPSPQAGMAWTRTLNPIWVTDFPFLEVEYEIEQAVLEPERHLILLSDDSTGPITPGALNPENPLASGSVAGLGTAEPGRHHIVRDLRDFFDSDRVARITFVLQSGDQSARLRVTRLIFWAVDPAKSDPLDCSTDSRPLLDAAPADALVSPKQARQWKALKLPDESTISSDWVACAFEASWPKEKQVQLSGIPFELGDADKAARVTAISDTAGSVHVEAQAQGTELALLLGLRAYGYDKPAYGKVPHRPREPITSPHEVVVELEYEDGGRRLHMPWAAREKQYAIQRLPQAYVVPLEPQRKLARFAIHDRMSFGQVFLLAASVNTGDRAHFPERSAERPPPAPRQLQRPEEHPARVSQQQSRLHVENAWLRLELETKAGLVLNHLSLIPYGHTVIASPVDLLEVFDERDQRLPLRLMDHTVEQTRTGTRLLVTWQAGDAPDQTSVGLQVDIENNGAILLRPTLNNPQESSWKVNVIYPQLKGCTISTSMEDSWYLLGTRNTALSNQPIRSDERYSGRHPLQFMNLFSAARGGGLAVFIQDSELMEKSFRLEQDASGAAMSVWFPRVTVPPADSLELPAAVIQAHVGDWHEGFRAYRDWARSVLLAGRGDYRLKDLFVCRRDYPLGGTGYLFNVREMKYTPKRLIEETGEGVGGIDLIDISGWAHSEEVGRVGDYLENDLGGLEELARAVEASHERGTKLGLYFEGYLVDRRAPLAEKALSAWQIVTEQGQPKWWTGEMEFYVCPAVEPWREALSGMFAEVARRTRADAVYIDQYGFSGAHRVCWSPEHGHPVPSNPPFEERKMLELIRRKLDQRAPATALYCEQMPCDGLVRYIDGAFNYGMVDTQASQHPTKLQLMRFVFPEVALIEMISSGIRPIPVPVDDLHRCFFHGLAFWMKGRIESWYSPQFQHDARRIAPVLQAHSAVFRSSRCTPLIPTLRSDLYANLFEGEGRKIVTIYNARYSDISGDLFEIELPEDWKVFELLEGVPATVVREGRRVVVQGELAPHSATAFLLARQDAGGERES